MPTIETVEPLDAKEITHLDILRNDVIYDLFVDTADQNYVVARWCYQNALHLDFLWNGAHSLEKFMKAALLLNGHSSIQPRRGSEPFGHNLERLYEAVKLLAPDLLPTMLIKPNELRGHWISEAVDDFIRRMSEGGDAHNRYQIFGYTTRSSDLYKFDKMVFAIRRLCCPLGKYFFGNIRTGQPALTFRDVLLNQPEYMPHDIGSHFFKLLRDGSDDVKYAALNHNLLFAPDDHDHGTLRSGFATRNPVLGRRVLDAVEHGVTGDEALETVQLVDWLLQNIFLPADVRKQMDDARGVLLTRCSAN